MATQRICAYWRVTDQTVKATKRTNKTGSCEIDSAIKNKSTKS